MADVQARRVPVIVLFQVLLIASDDVIYQFPRRVLFLHALSECESNGDQSARFFGSLFNWLFVHQVLHVLQGIHFFRCQFIYLDCVSILLHIHE